LEFDDYGMGVWWSKRFGSVTVYHLVSGVRDEGMVYVWDSDYLEGIIVE